MNEQQKQTINDFENMKDLAELKALSTYSLENPLSEKQREKMIELKNKTESEWQMKKELKKQIKKAIENFEYYNSGAKYNNGGDAIVSKMKVEEEKGTLIVNCAVTICEYEKSTTYNNCQYILDKETFKLLTDKEIKARDLDLWGKKKWRNKK